MSKYYSFNEFMDNVLQRADQIIRQRHGCGLEEYYQVSHTTYKAIRSLINKGWWVFIAVVALFSVGYIGIGAAIIAFLATPVGAIVLVTLGIGAMATIMQMYRDKILPKAVKFVGETYKPRWERVEGNTGAIDNLVEEAAESLINKATFR